VQFVSSRRPRCAQPDGVLAPIGSAPARADPSLHERFDMVDLTRRVSSLEANVKDFARVVVVPPLRCCHRLADSSLAVCGREARWATAATVRQFPLFYCDEHRLEGDVLIPPDVAFRRIRVQVEVLLAGACGGAGESHAEAAELVRRAVEAIGGIPNLVAVYSDIARRTWPARPGESKASGGVST